MSMYRFHFEVAGSVREGASLVTEYVIPAANDKLLSGAAIKQAASEAQQLARLRYAQEFPEYLPVRYVAWTGYEKGENPSD